MACTLPPPAAAFASTMLNPIEIHQFPQSPALWAFGAEQSAVSMPPGGGMMPGQHAVMGVPQQASPSQIMVLLIFS